MKNEKMRKAYEKEKKASTSVKTVSLTCTEFTVLGNMQTASNSTSISRIFLIYTFKAENPLLYTLGNIKLHFFW